MRHKLTEFLQWNLDITEPLYNEVLIHYITTITNTILHYSSNSKIYEKEPRYNENMVL